MKLCSASPIFGLQTGFQAKRGSHGRPHQRYRPRFHRRKSTAGTIRFHEWLGDSYGIIFSHPRDFTPVCTTEFAAVAQLAAEWKKRNTKVIGVSVDGVADHEKVEARHRELSAVRRPNSRSSTTPA